jgi:chromate transport protein ChrA
MRDERGTKDAWMYERWMNSKIVKTDMNAIFVSVVTLVLIVTCRFVKKTLTLTTHSHNKNIIIIFFHCASKFNY